MAQDEATRRRYRMLGHLPLTGAFKLCEVRALCMLWGTYVSVRVQGEWGPCHVACQPARALPAADPHATRPSTELQVSTLMSMNCPAGWAQVDLSGLLPAEALAPFADELAQRERKRVQRAKQVGGAGAAVAGACLVVAYGGRLPVALLGACPTRVLLFRLPLSPPHTVPGPAAGGAPRCQGGQGRSGSCSRQPGPRAG